jgi:hypothetical protein
MGDKQFFAGLDESNNGNKPEVVVFSYTQNPSYIQHTEKPLVKGKKRNETLEEISHEFPDIDFHFTVLYGDLLYEMSSRHHLLKKLSLITLFYEHLKNHHDIDFDNVQLISDGNLKKQKLEYQLKSRGIPLPQFSGKADIHYPIVNHADRVAYRLFDDYRDIRKSNSDRNPLIEQIYEKRIWMPSNYLDQFEL